MLYGLAYALARALLGLLVRWGRLSAGDVELLALRHEQRSLSRTGRRGAWLCSAQTRRLRSDVPSGRTSALLRRRARTLDGALLGPGSRADRAPRPARATRPRAPAAGTRTRGRSWRRGA